MALTPSELVSCGVDWITLTAPLTEGGTELASSAAPLLEIERDRGCIMKPWSMSGYEGFRAGMVACGTRHDSGIVRLSSDMAQQHWRHFHANSKNCSRIDVQATYRFLEEPAQVIRDCFRSTTRRASTTKGGPTIALFTEHGGSNTVYVGKRISDRFARIYDKYEESSLPEFRHCVRYEIELKNSQAYSAANALAATVNKSISGDTRLSEVAVVQGWVADYFSRAGVTTNFACARQSLVTSACFRSNVLTQLTWLRQGVSPTVERLQQSGFAKEAIESLFGSVEALRKLLIAIDDVGPCGPTEAAFDSGEFERTERYVS